MAAVVVYGEAFLERQKDPERIWDEPDACDDEMEEEVRSLISAWSSHIGHLD